MRLLRILVNRLFLLAMFLIFLQIFIGLNVFSRPIPVNKNPSLSADKTGIQKGHTKTAGELHAEGLRFFNKDMYEKALELWLQEFGLNPNNAKTANNIGLAYKRLKDYQAAIKYYQKAIELNPTYWHAHNNLGVTYYEIGDYKNAVNFYLKTLEVECDPKVYFNLGSAYNGLQEYDKAISSLNKALDLKYDPDDCYFQLGRAYYGLKQYENGIGAFKKLQPYSPEVRFYLGEGYKGLGKLLQARREFRKALYSGYYYERKDAAKEAIEEIDKGAPYYKYIDISIQILQFLLFPFIIIGMPVGYVFLLKNQRLFHTPNKQKIFILAFFMLFLPTPTFTITTLFLVPAPFSISIGFNAASLTYGWERVIGYILAFINYFALVIFNYFLVCILHKNIKSEKTLWMINGLLVTVSFLDIYWFGIPGKNNYLINFPDLFDKMMLEPLDSLFK